jgi:hypothetical protein
MHATKVCEFCNQSPAKHLGPMENGPMFGLELEGETDNYCSHDCWESELAIKNKVADKDA